MRTLRTLVFAAAASVAMSTAALATDLYEAVAPVYEADDGHDWGGFYVGKLGGMSVGWDSECGGDCSESFFGFSKVFGYNWDQGDIIYGIDKMVTFTWIDEEDFWKLSIQKMGRVGIEVTDNAMIYGAAGMGWSTLLCDGCSGGVFYAGVAAGLEVAVADNLNWRTHVQYSKPLHPDLSWLNVVSVGTGLVWQFN